MDGARTPWQGDPMRRTDRLFDILQILRDGQLHRAQDLAARLQVSVRTIYRDMDRLAANGIAVEGERGTGYRLRGGVTLPPLTLTPEELEALNIGVAIVAEADDPGLKAAAQALADKIDALLPAEPEAEAAAWQRAVSPFADSARGFRHMAALRSAIRGRQKLRLRYRRTDGAVSDRTVRPLHMAYWSRVWILTAWCEMRADFREFRVDLIEEAVPLPELFVDEPGRRYADYRGRRETGI